MKLDFALRTYELKVYFYHTLYGITSLHDDEVYIRKKKPESVPVWGVDWIRDDIRAGWRVLLLHGQVRDRMVVIDLIRRALSTTPGTVSVSSPVALREVLQLLRMGEETKVPGGPTVMAEHKTYVQKEGVRGDDPRGEGAVAVGEHKIDMSGAGSAGAVSAGSAGAGPSGAAPVPSLVARRLRPQTAVPRSIARSKGIPVAGAGVGAGAEPKTLTDYRDMTKQQLKDYADRYNISVKMSMLKDTMIQTIMNHQKADQ